ncbi:MAG: hypothetical protein ACR2LC_09585 [Pyrinomonadaceae bacterium]
MRNTQFSATLLLTVVMTAMVCFASLGFKACNESPPGSATASSSNSYHKAVKATVTIEDTVATGIDTVAELRSTGLIDDSADLALSKALLAVHRANKNFYTRAADYKTFDPKARAELPRLFTDVTASIKNLNDTGDTYVKNPRAREKISLLLSSLNAAAQIISVTLEAGK